MKFCFVGIGSIARRHIRNLYKICQERGIEISIDALRRSETGMTDLPEHIDNVYTDANCLPTNYDVIFLTNPTEYHADMLIALHENARHFFIEKPVTSLDTADRLNGFCFREESVYYVACPMRYTGVIQYLKQNINVNTVNAVRSISSSYLPDWRPGTDYRKTYSAHRNLGGGVDIDLIHEWDYLTYLFGMPSNIKSFSGKVSKLDIDSCDYAIYIAQFNDSMVAELHLDYFGRENIRKIDIFTDEDTICGDFISGRICYMKSKEIIEVSSDRDIYQMRELQYFLDAIQREKPLQNDVVNAVKLLKLTQGILE